MEANEKKRLKFLLNLRKNMEELGLTLSDINDVFGMKKVRTVRTYTGKREKKKFLPADVDKRIREDVIRFLGYGWKTGKIIDSVEKATGHRIRQQKVCYIRNKYFHPEPEGKKERIKTSVFHGKATHSVEKAIE